MTKEDVTPYVGVWIETIYTKEVCVNGSVTPYVGVWIETVQAYKDKWDENVTPYVGVWIETVIDGDVKHRRAGHSLCGSVD